MPCPYANASHSTALTPDTLPIAHRGTACRARLVEHKLDTPKLPRICRRHGLQDIPVIQAPRRGTACRARCARDQPEDRHHALRQRPPRRQPGQNCRTSSQNRPAANPLYLRPRPGPATTANPHHWPARCAGKNRWPAAHRPRRYQPGIPPPWRLPADGPHRRGQNRNRARPRRTAARQQRRPVPDRHEYPQPGTLRFRTDRCAAGLCRQQGRPHPVQRRQDPGQLQQAWHCPVR